MSTAASPLDAPRPAPSAGGRDAADRATRLAVGLLALVSWASAGMFGLYILAHFGGAVQDGAPERWNTALPRLFETERPAANWGIGLHFAAGAVLLVLGPLQLIGAVRRRAPAFHRWTGRVYAGAAFLAGVGGLTFIALRGTVGGPAMSAGFAVYGVLMALCAVETVRCAMARRFETHRAWAIRLFALAIGSWLYRVEYGVWYLIAGTQGHTEDFRGWFDLVMNWAFFVPNLVVAELVIRAGGRGSRPSPALRWAAAGAVSGAAAIVAVASVFFAAFIWWPAIASRF